MTSLPDDWNDIWTTLNPQQLATDNVALKLDIINDIQPLDDQFGADPKKTAPDALYGVLFGQSQPSDVEIAVAGGDPQNVPPIQTYALLDAAKITHLSEMLGASDLEHSCLFKGDAYEDLKDAAPWLVRLEEGNSFTRNLFTKGDAPWHFWGAEAGIYIRSRASLEELWKHFRKFTRIKDENEKWYYIRYYSPRAAIKLLDQYCFWTRLLSDNIITILLLVSGSGVQISHKDTFPKHTPKPFLDIDRERQKELMRKLETNVDLTLSLMSFPNEKLPIARQIAMWSMQRMMKYGFKNTKHLRIFAVWELTYGIRYEEYDPDGKLLSICQEKAPALKRFKRFMKRMDQVNFQPRSF